MTTTENLGSPINFTPVSDERLIAWYHAISQSGPQVGLASADELAQVKAEIMRRGLDLSPAIDQRPSQLPFLLPAANLAIGNTIPGGTIFLLRDGRHGVNVEFADGTSKVFQPDELVEVTRRSPAAALNDVVTALTGLFEQWHHTADTLLNASDASDLDTSPLLAADMLTEARTRRECAAGVYAILARLQ
jgi:hypothetical protein